MFSINVLVTLFSNSLCNYIFYGERLLCLLLQSVSLAYMTVYLRGLRFVQYFKSFETFPMMNVQAVYDFLPNKDGNVFVVENE